MKIRKIEFKNHPILNDFEIDFSIDNVVRNISLLVAENGCGKTVLLEEIQKILVGGISIWGDGINRKITLEFTEDEKNKLNLPTNIISIEYDESKSAEPNWLRFSIFDQDGTDISNTTRQQLHNSNSFNNIFKCAFSTVEINFEKRNIDSVKATTIDSDEFVKNKSTANIATEIAQLLVDIKNQDNADKANHFDNGNSNKNIEYKGKFDRFKNAYSKMFDGKELMDVVTKNNNYKVFFKDLKNGVEFDISDLSSGEKQIVYRVGYLLRNLRGINGGVVLIDEPELSLHPIWQEKYLQFIRDVFFAENNDSIQFIIATHSPLILKGIMEKDVSVHVFKKDDKGKIVVTNAQEKGFGLFKWSPSWGEICYFAYELPTIEFHNELYNEIETEFWNDQNNDFKTLKTNGSYDKDDCRQIIFDNEFFNKVKQEPIDSNFKTTPNKVTKHTYIRNKIHHSTENGGLPTGKELKESIEKLIEFIL